MITVVGRLLARVQPPTGAAGPAAQPDPRTSGAVGLTGAAARIAQDAAAGGSAVELIAKLGDDRLGDATLFALSRAGIRHNAILRDAAHATPVSLAPASSSATQGDDTADADDEWAEAIEADAAAEASASTPDPDLAGLPLAPGDLELALRYLIDVTVVILADPSPGPLLAAAAEGAAFHGAALILLGDPESLLAAGAPEDATILGAPAQDPDGRFAALVAEYAVALDGGKAPAEAWEAATRRLGVERA